MQNDIYNNKQDKKGNIITNKKKRNDYPRFLEKGKKYYYIDENNLEWEFKEKVGSKDNFYFSFTTNNYFAFGINNRNDNNKIFLAY